MKTVVLHLPDSVQLGEQELQALLMQKLAETNPQAFAATGPVAAMVQVPAEDAAEIRHLIGLYYAEKATAAMDAQWEENSWTAATMEQWLTERMRSSSRKAS